jgi:hypothetical protein
LNWQNTEQAAGSITFRARSSNLRFVNLIPHGRHVIFGVYAGIFNSETTSLTVRGVCQASSGQHGRRT